MEVLYEPSGVVGVFGSSEPSGGVEGTELSSEYGGGRERERVVVREAKDTRYHRRRCERQAGLALKACVAVLMYNVIFARAPKRLEMRSKGALDRHTSVDPVGREGCHANPRSSIIASKPEAQTIDSTDIRAVAVRFFGACCRSSRTPNHIK